MTRLLIYEPALRRLETRIADVAGKLDLLVLDREGKLSHGGAPVENDAAQPEIAFMSADMFGSPATRDFMVALLKAGGLKWVQSAAAGFDNPIFGQLVGKGVRLSTSHGQAVGMAETVLHGVLDHFQHGPARRAEQAAHKWVSHPFREVMDSRWLVVGFGAIGAGVAVRAKAFGAHVTGVRRSQSPHPAADRIAPMSELQALLPDADVVVLCAPLTAETTDLADAAFFGAMKAGSVFVNVGRGKLVDEAALLAALDRGTPAHAVLDVFHAEPLPADAPFWDHPRVSLTPHNSGVSNGVMARNDALFVDNLHRYLAGEALLNEADPKDVLG